MRGFFNPENEDKIYKRSDKVTNTYNGQNLMIIGVSKKNRSKGTEQRLKLWKHSRNLKKMKLQVRKSHHIPETISIKILIF